MFLYIHKNIKTFLTSMRLAIVSAPPVDSL